MVSRGTTHTATRAAITARTGSNASPRPDGSSRKVKVIAEERIAKVPKAIAKEAKEAKAIAKVTRATAKSAKATAKEAKAT
jgi:hypothetical protein